MHIFHSSTLSMLKHSDWLITKVVIRFSESKWCHKASAFSSSGNDPHGVLAVIYGDLSSALWQNIRKSRAAHFPGLVLQLGPYGLMRDKWGHTHTYAHTQTQKERLRWHYSLLVLLLSCFLCICMITLLWYNILLVYLCYPSFICICKSALCGYI